LLAAIIVSKIYNIYKFSIGKKKPDWGAGGAIDTAHSSQLFCFKLFFEKLLYREREEYNKKRKGEKKK